MNVVHIHGRRGSWGSADEGCSGARSASRPRPPSRPARPPRTALGQRPRPGRRTAPEEVNTRRSGASSRRGPAPTPRSPTSAWPATAGAPTFPRRPVVADVVKDYGAAPDGSADAAPAINRALHDAGLRGGGTVLVPAGTYRIDDIIRIGHDNVVLRGAGSGRTTLYATRSLTEIIGPYGSRYGGDKSSWSWAGGLIWLCPSARWQTLTAAIGSADWPFEGWTGNRRDEWRTLTALTGPTARQGDRTVTVQDTGTLRPATVCCSNSPTTPVTPSSGT